MGTSKSFATPSGGAWTSPKRQLTDCVTGREPLDAKLFVRSAMRAVGGVGMKPRVTLGGGESHAPSSGGGGGARGGSNRSGRPSAGVSAFSGVVRGVGGFGAQVASAGLDAALGFLGLGELRGRPAAEVVARIAEHLSRDATGRQAEILESTLRDTIFDIAAIEGDGSYQDLETALQSFMEREGLEGFVDAFLSRYVFEAVWSYFENHANGKADGGNSVALASAVESACRSLISQELKSYRENQEFDHLDWFGRAGQQVADRIVDQLQSNICGLR